MLMVCYVTSDFETCLGEADSNDELSCICKSDTRSVNETDQTRVIAHEIKSLMK